MVIPQDWDYNFDEEISNDEYQVIYKFLSSYKDQNVIVADRFRQDFSMVPLQDEKIIFKMDNDIWKSMDFYKRIFYKGRPYIVGLELWRTNYMKNLAIHELKIVTKGRVHFINLDIRDIAKRDLLFNIINVFDEAKVISPEQAYCKQMYVNKSLQEFMMNHEWQKINEGIKQKPSLTNSLFIMSEGYESSSHYKADFATVLYQLINFRTHNIATLIKDEKDLYELDKLILKLSKAELLKVQLHEQISNVKSYPSESILLEETNSDARVHESEQYNVCNGELLIENSILKRLVKDLKKN